jgi:DNA-binding SARP family transcriptional activator
VGLLGPLEVVDDSGGLIMVAGPRQRVLLAALAARANEPVSPDALAEAVWDGAPPPGYPATLRSHLMRLRRALGPQIAEVPPLSWTRSFYAANVCCCWSRFRVSIGVR